MFRNAAAGAVTICLICLVFQGRVSAQSDDVNNHLPVANTVFVEVAGSGIFLSFNYERFLTRNLSVRGGIGTIIVASSLPLMLNLHAGEINQLEIGIGVVRIAGEFIDDFETTILCGTVGYRRQPISDGLVFRIGFTPLYSPDVGEVLLYGGLSIGRAF